MEKNSMKIINCNVLFSIFLLFSYFYLGMAWAGGTLFSDDFEGDTVGQPASLWELAGGAPGKGAKVVKDPLDPNNKVIFVNGPKWVGDLPEGAWAPKDKSYLKWTDYTFEGDFMVDDPSKLFAFNYRAKDYDNMMHYNVRRWDKGIVGVYTRENAQWTGAVKEIQHPTKHKVWYTAQVDVKGHNHTFKIKEAKDKTDFAKIDPLIEEEIKDTKLDSGTIQVMCYGFADNIIVYVDFKDVEAKNKLTTTWAQIRRVN
jgi:hypothetical protein